MIRKDKNLQHLQKKFKHKYTNDKSYHKVNNHCYYTVKQRSVVHSFCNLKKYIKTDCSGFSQWIKLQLSFSNKKKQKKRF